MTMSAFGQAMLDQLEHPGSDVSFRMSIVGGPGIECPCQDFLHVRPEEQDLIRDCLHGNECPQVLDMGCGLGRHSHFVRSCSPGAAVTMVETDQKLRARATRDVPGAMGHAQFRDIPASARFDLVLLLGNGLGIFGGEQATRDGLGRVAGMLSEGGHALIESGNFAEGEFYEASHQIEYGRLTDGPFSWGYATRTWLERELETTGLDLVSVTRSSRGGPFFIVHATKGA